MQCHTVTHERKLRSCATTSPKACNTALNERNSVDSVCVSTHHKRMHEIQRDIRHADSQCGLIVDCTGKVSEACTQIRRSRTVNTRHGDTVCCERLVVGHCVDDEYVVVSLDWDFECVEVSIGNTHAIVWLQLLDVGLSWIFKSPTSMCFHNCPRATGEQPSSRVRVEQLMNDAAGELLRFPSLPLAPAGWIPAANEHEPVCGWWTSPSAHCASATRSSCLLVRECCTDGSWLMLE